MVDYQCAACHLRKPDVEFYTKPERRFLCKGCALLLQAKKK